MVLCIKIIATATSFLFPLVIIHMQPWQTLTPLLRSLWRVSEAPFWLIELCYSDDRCKMCYPLPLTLGIARKQSSGERKVGYVQEVIYDLMCCGHMWGRSELSHSHQFSLPPVWNPTSFSSYPACVIKHHLCAEPYEGMFQQSEKRNLPAK